MENSQNQDVSSRQEPDLSELFSMISNISDMSSDSKESSLLTSLKPYLNKKRQKKLEQCSKIMMLTDAFKLLNDLHFFDNSEENTEE